MNGERRMRRYGRTNLPYVTIALTVLNAAVFLVTDLLLRDRDPEVAYYMSLNPFLAWNRGEYWRFFTSMFYHFGIEHLASNLLMLYFTGTMLEQTFGHIRFLILFVGSGLMGGAASVFYNSVIVPENAAKVYCAGASGAVYGLIGAYAVSFFFQRRRVSGEEKTRIAVAVIFLLFGTIYDTGVGHDAHFGGFFAGTLIGMLYSVMERNKHRRRSDTGQ